MKSVTMFRLISLITTCTGFSSVPAPDKKNEVDLHTYTLPLPIWGFEPTSRPPSETGYAKMGPVCKNTPLPKDAHEVKLSMLGILHDEKLSTPSDKLNNFFSHGFEEELSRDFLMVKTSGGIVTELASEKEIGSFLAKEEVQRFGIEELIRDFLVAGAEIWKFKTTCIKDSEIAHVPFGIQLYSIFWIVSSAFATGEVNERLEASRQRLSRLEAARSRLGAALSEAFKDGWSHGDQNVFLQLTAVHRHCALYGASTIEALEMIKEDSSLTAWDVETKMFGNWFNQGDAEEWAMSHDATAKQVLGDLLSYLERVFMIKLNVISMLPIPQALRGFRNADHNILEHIARVDLQYYTEKIRLAHLQDSYSRVFADYSAAMTGLTPLKVDVNRGKGDYGKCQGTYHPYLVNGEAKTSFDKIIYVNDSRVLAYNGRMWIFTNISFLPQILDGSIGRNFGGFASNDDGEEDILSTTWANYHIREKRTMVNVYFEAIQSKLGEFVNDTRSPSSPFAITRKAQQKLG